jgi:hypothetical protein
MVDQRPSLLEVLVQINNTFLFQQHFKATCDFLPPLAQTCFPPFEFIKQHMVHLQNSISEHLHHHAFFNMLFDEIFEAHFAQILSCSSLGVCVWFIT